MATLGSVIKSIQRSTITISTGTSNTATITAVATGKSVVLNTGETTNLGASGSLTAYLTLTNETTVTATRNDNGTDTTVVGFAVVEFY